MIDFKEVNKAHVKYGKAMKDKPEEYVMFVGDLNKAQLVKQIYPRDDEIARLNHYIGLMEKSFDTYHDNAEFEIHELKRQIKKISTIRACLR